jgi:hypothetical protein
MNILIVWKTTNGLPQMNTRIDDVVDCLLDKDIFRIKTKTGRAYVNKDSIDLLRVEDEYPIPVR